MARNKKKHGNKKSTGGVTIAIPSTNNIMSTKHVRANTSDHTTTVPVSEPHSLDANAARTVFNTADLLEMVLVHASTKTLGRALSVSKHCRDVVLGNQELRQKLFLGPAQATEWLSNDRFIQETLGAPFGVPQTSFRL